MSEQFYITPYSNGYIERKSGGAYEGEITVDGVFLGDISGVYFKECGKTYLWLRRKKKLEYIMESQQFIAKEQTPRWEVYMSRIEGKPYVFHGKFMFLRFKYAIYGVWDRNGDSRKERLNLFVDRLDMKEQDIILKINRNNNEQQ